ncbi:Ras protein [Mycena venus]|uniref:Ras protein n=1 Tax=Mycena venus TaxID=2733690 RepID=A0A8H6Z0J3_9AGAR|nr:Ras protein [Mycena venus]
MDRRFIAVLGAPRVGKASFATQFCLNCWFDGDRSEYEYAYRKQMIVDNRMCFVEVFVAGPQEDALSGAWMQQAQGFLLMYAISSRKSFERLDELRRIVVHAKGAVPPMIVVANKIDKDKYVEEREVTKAEGVALAARFGCPVMETSAKTGQNVERVFANLVRALRNTDSGRGAVQRENRTTKCVVL